MDICEEIKMMIMIIKFKLLSYVLVSIYFYKNKIYFIQV
jgi:hypothetical protein